MKYLELLSPAKNADQGMAAINHGADAVYIGAPLFGARSAAGNSIDDIEQLVKYAHVYHSKVFATVNTLLFDEELEEARKLIYQLYNIGVDALIIQDLGILEMDIPPIALHASTQMHNYDMERIKFMEQAGFQRVILARETSLVQMQAIRECTSVELEAFIQGALCVSFSGQCYMSQYLNERSGNRGCCGQPCRSSYDLYNESGKLLRRQEHLLSLKDFNASHHIADMVDAGISSFKIEGRLKDLSYVKNVTAYYRQLLDQIMEGREDLGPVSHGTTKCFFTPDLSRTYNRDFTNYFLEERKPMASMETQKSIGKLMGKVVSIGKNSLTIKTRETFTAGDGLCYFTPKRELEGFFVNHVNGNTITPNRLPESITVGTTVWRNNDFAFEKQLQGKSSERKINITFTLGDTDNGFSLIAADDYGNIGTAEVTCEKSMARDIEKARDQIGKQLSKLGETPFAMKEYHTRFSQTGENDLYFIAAATINELRRESTRQLEEARRKAYWPSDCKTDANDTHYFETELDYRANVVNSLSRKFYERHGATVQEKGLEVSKDYEGKALMTTKYCLRYELKQCLQLKANKEVDADFKGNLYLRNNKNYFLLQFDCKNCMMKVLLKEKQR